MLCLPINNEGLGHPGASSPPGVFSGLRTRSMVTPLPSSQTAIPSQSVISCNVCFREDKQIQVSQWMQANSWEFSPWDLKIDIRGSIHSKTFSQNPNSMKISEIPCDGRSTQHKPTRIHLEWTASKIGAAESKTGDKLVLSEINAIGTLNTAQVWIFQDGVVPLLNTDIPLPQAGNNKKTKLIHSSTRLQLSLFTYQT